MSESWKDGYRRALYGYVIDQGDGGFFHRDAQQHLRVCMPDYAASRLEESSWDRYGDDSLYDGPTVEDHGVDAEITCICGSVHRARLRVRASVGQILLDLLSRED